MKTISQLAKEVLNFDSFFRFPDVSGLGSILNNISRIISDITAFSVGVAAPVIADGVHNEEERERLRQGGFQNG